MLNLVLKIGKNNLNPVLESLGADSENYVILREGSEAIIDRILQEMSCSNDPRKVRVMLTASHCGETRFYNIKEVRYLESVRNLIVIFGEKDRFEFYGVLYKIEQEIRQFGFCRVNHSYLVSMEHIRKIRGGYVVLDDGTAISIGRRYRSHFQRMLKKRNTISLNS